MPDPVLAILGLPHIQMVEAITRLHIEHSNMRASLTQISEMVEPSEMEEDEDGFTEWGCPADEAFPMAYENAIWTAQSALRNLEK